MNISGNSVMVVLSIILQIVICNYVSTTVLVNIGETMSLKCLVNTSNILAFEWNHEGETIFLHHGYFVGEERKEGFTASFASERNIYQLDIFVHGSENLGTFNCIQYSLKGKSTISWILKEKVKQYGSIGGNITSVTVGNSVELDCSPNASTAFTVQWEHNGNHIRQDNYSNVIGDYHPFRLLITDVSREDAGNYSCFSFFKNGRNLTTFWSILVKDKEPDDFTITSPLGNSANLTCTLEQSKGTLIAVYWNHGSNEILHHDASHTKVTKDKYISKISKDYSMIQLNILIVGYADNGRYSCVSFHENGAGTTKSWILEVKGKRNTAKGRLLPVYGSTELNCYSDNPRDVTAIKWILNHQVIKDTKITGYNIEGTFSDDPLTSYHIVNASFGEAGNYFCFSYLKNHTSQETAWTVQIQGYTTLTLSKNTANENEIITALCCVEFGMTPVSYDVHWLLDGRNFNFNGENTNFQKKNTEKTFCNILEFSLEREFHGKSLDCLVQNELNRTSSHILTVFYPPTILDIQHVHILSNEGFYVTCTVDAHPDPVVTLEKKTKQGRWKEISRSPVPTSRMNNIVEWKFSLSERGEFSYRCIASITNGSAAISQEIVTNCFWSCALDGIGGVLLLAAVTFVGVIVIVTIIFMISALLKRMRRGFAVSSPTNSGLQSPQFEHLACATEYENFPPVWTSKNQQVPVSVRASDGLVGDENYSLVTINETIFQTGDGKELDRTNDGIVSTLKGSKTRIMQHQTRVSRNQNIRVNRKPIPRRKPRQRRNQRKFSEIPNETPAAIRQQKDVLYATVNKEKSAPIEIVQYATVQKYKGSTEEDDSTSSHANRDDPPPLNIADSMYGKVKKKKVWKTDQ